MADASSIPAAWIGAGAALGGVALAEIAHIGWDILRARRERREAIRKRVRRAARQSLVPVAQIEQDIVELCARCGKDSDLDRSVVDGKTGKRDRAIDDALWNFGTRLAAMATATARLEVDFLRPGERGIRPPGDAAVEKSGKTNIFSIYEEVAQSVASLKKGIDQAKDWRAIETELTAWKPKIVAEHAALETALNGLVKDPEAVSIA